MVHRVLSDKTYLSLGVMSPLSYQMLFRSLFVYFEWPFYKGFPASSFGGTSFAVHLCFVFFCLVFVMPLCASAYLCLVVTW